MDHYTEQSGHTLIRIGGIDVRYYVREPSPDHWNAIGIILGVESSRESTTTTSSPMIVGTGATPDEAVGNMIARVISRDHPDLASMLTADRETETMEPVHSVS